MLARIIEWSVGHRFLVLLATVAITIAGLWAMWRTPVDAIPGLSDVQVIVMTRWPGQGPQLVEDQVTYPMETEMLKVPHTKYVRGMSQFGLSAVYVAFDDGTDLYWALARARVPELGAREAAARRHDHARSRCHRRGLGDAVHPGRYHGPDESRPAPERAGLDGAPGAHRRARRGGDRIPGWLRAAVPGDRGSRQAARLQHSTREGDGGRARLERGCGRTRAGDERLGVRGARARAVPQSRRHSRGVARHGCRRHAHHRGRCGPGAARPRHPARDRRSRWQGGDRDRVGGHALR